MEESIEHSPNQQQRKRSGYRPMSRKRHSRVWNESSERRESRKAAATSSVEPASCPAVNPNLIYFDVNTEQIEVTDADPLAPAAVLEKANQVPRDSVVPPSQEFLQNVRNRFVKIEDVIEPEEVPGTPEAKPEPEPVKVKIEPVEPTVSKKANYSYTQLDLDTQMLDILEGADMLAGLGTCPEQRELKEWSSPAKAPPKEVEEKIRVEKEPDKRKRRLRARKDRSSKRYHEVRQSSFSRDVSMVLPGCSTPPEYLSTSILLDFESDSDAEFTIDYSRILSTPLRRRLIQLQNRIDSPPQQVNRESIRRTFSRRTRRRSNVEKDSKTPIVVRRLSMESKASDRNEELSSDEELAATQIDPDRLVPLEPSPEKENFDASLLIKANINQLSQFFSQSVEVQERSKSTPELTPSREEVSEVAPLPSSPISLESIGGGSSPRTLNIEWLFRSDSEGSKYESSESQSDSHDEDEGKEKVDEKDAVCELVKTEPDEALHRMLDDDDEFLVQLPTTQKEVIPKKSVVEKETESVEGTDDGNFVKRPHTSPPLIAPPRQPPPPPEPSTSFSTLAPPPSIAPPTFPGGGFQTARGSDILVSKKSLAKARRLLADEDAKLARDESWQKLLALDEAVTCAAEPAPAVLVRSTMAVGGGFQTARGGSIKVSEEEMAKGRVRLEQVEREVEGGEGMSFGFKTAKGGGITVSKEALAKAQLKQQQFEAEEESCAEQPSLGGFKTAKGGGITVSKEALEKAKLKQQQFELEVESASTSKAPKNVALTKAHKIFHQVEHEGKPSFGQPRQKAFNPPAQLQVETPRDSSSKRLPDDELDPETPLKRPKPSRLSLTNFSTSTPNLTATTTSGKPQNNKDLEMANFFNDLDDRHFHELFCEEEPQPAKERRPLRQVRLASRFEECEKEENEEEVVQNPGNPTATPWDDSFGEVVAKLSSDGTVGVGLKVAQQVLDARRLVRERQREYVKEKSQEERRPRLYEFVRKKKQLSGRVSLRRLVVGGAGAMREATKETAGESGIAEQIRLLNVENVTEFKFEVEMFYGKQFAQENTTGILLGDPDIPIHVIPDDTSRVGLEEFTSAFLTAPGIDPSLVPPGWIENAWKWILLKLSSMERQLPQHFCDITNPGNVMDQLLFRYHVEIDCAKRSVIRKMLEKDDVPGKRMVLFVSRVFRGNPFEAEIELCDGWYPIRTVLDYPLTEAVLKGWIVIGTKLMIQGAELLNLNEGCAPLEVPIDVRLRIHANSTRRAHWLAKLGLYQIPTSFLVSCNNIADRGGLVVRVQLVVIRVYPTLYKEKTQNGGAQGSVLRSERVERRRSMVNDANRFDDFQKLFSQVQKELESERSEKVSRKRQMTTVTRSTTTAELLELMEGGLDLSCLEYELSSTQRDAILDHQRRKQEEFAQEVNRRIKDLMTSGAGSQKITEGSSSESRTVIPLLKLRVMDARKPEKTLLMSIWRPPEDIGEVVQERRVLEVINVTANGSKNGEIQLSTGKNSNYKVLDRMQFDLPERFFRRVTKIAEIDPFNFQPLYNEFDTVGVVVHVAALDTKKFQDVYLADVNMNLLCVNFWSGIKEYAYEDVVKERSILCVSNLQWRSFNLSSTIPNSFANELTTFSEHSKAEHFSVELAEFKATLSSIDLDQFFQDCSAKVLSLKDKKLPRSNSFNTPLRNTSSSNVSISSTPARTLLGNLSNAHHTPTPTNFASPVGAVSLQKRKIELLTAAYRSPPKKSPIVLRRNPRVGRNFKTPLRLEEKIEQS